MDTYRDTPLAQMQKRIGDVEERQAAISGEQEALRERLASAENTKDFLGCLQLIGLALGLVAIVGGIYAGWSVYDHSERQWAADCSRACHGIGLQFAGRADREGTTESCVCSGDGRVVRFTPLYDCAEQVYPPPMDGGVRCH